MKVLYYNWVQFDDDLRRGGGVSIYLANVLGKLTTLPEYKVYFLSSGMAYDLFRRTPYIRQTKNFLDRHDCKSFEFVNSPILAPGHSAFFAIDQLFNSPETNDIFFKFLERHGPFDIIHLNNIEGIPFTALKLKKLFPDTKLLYSLHNYFAFCPQVNLWKKEKANCRDNRAGLDCVTCLPIAPDTNKLKRRVEAKISFFPESWKDSCREIYRKYRPFFDGLDRNYERIILGNTPKPITPGSRRRLATKFLYRNSELQKILIENVDYFLAVSTRTKDIAMRMGLPEHKILVSYIGSKFTGNSTRYKASDSPKSTFKLAYMGYMRRDKGFYFFVKALEKMDQSTACRLEVLIAAGLTDPIAIRRLKRMEKKFRRLTLLDGYSHDELETLLQDVNLGIVPVLWEDNLPQVAIEFVAMGVPILTSDLGGAAEIGNNPDFVFKAGSIRDFHAKLKRIVANRGLIEQFWKTAKPLVSIDEHISELLRIYSRAST